MFTGLLQSFAQLENKHILFAQFYKENAMVP